MHYLLCTLITDEALAVLAENGATVTVLREHAPHVKLVALNAGAVYHGRSAITHAIAYTLNQKTGEGICYWDSNPTTCQIYYWNKHATGPAFAGPSEEQAQLRPRVAKLCAQIARAHPLPAGNVWAAQNEWLNAQASDLLRLVAPLLPDDVRQPIKQAIAHHQAISIAAPDDTPIGDISHLDS